MANDGYEVRILTSYKCNTEANIGGPAGISNDENVLDADHATLIKPSE